jgi:O-methyltransferase domain
MADGSRSVDEMLPSMSRFHRYMREYGKKDVLTYTETPHSWADGKLGSTYWEVLNTDPKRVTDFARGLSLFDALHPIIGIYPFEEQHKAGNSPDRTLAVDVGGGRGLAMLDLRKGCPSLQGKMILQDRPEVLEAIPPEELPGVEKTQHDFFSPQPVQGAQIYLIRRVFHDWLDPEARKILQQIVPAMSSDSRILISDMALPEPVTAQDAHAVWLDLMMMTIGGKERTKKDWETLVKSAGLKLVKMWQTPQTGPLVVVECALPDAPALGSTEKGTTATKADEEVNGVANGMEKVSVNGK